MCGTEFRLQSQQAVHLYRLAGFSRQMWACLAHGRISSILALSPPNTQGRPQLWRQSTDPHKIPKCPLGGSPSPTASFPHHLGTQRGPSGEQGLDASSDPGVPAGEDPAAGKMIGVARARLPRQDFFRPLRLLCWRREQQAPGLRRRSRESDFNQRGTTEVSSQHRQVV